MVRVRIKARAIAWFRARVSVWRGVAACLLDGLEVRERAPELARGEDGLAVQLPVEVALFVEVVGPEHLGAVVLRAASLLEASEHARLVDSGHACQLGGVFAQVLLHTPSHVLVRIRGWG